MKPTNHQSSQDLATFLWRRLSANEQKSRGSIAAIFERHRVAYAESEARVQALVQEIELDGGNTIANVGRRRGVSYERVVRDVCAQLKYTISSEITENVPEMERQLVYHVIANYLQNAPEVDRNLLRAALKERGVNWEVLGVQGAATAAMWASLLQQVGSRAAAQVVRQVLLRTSGWLGARAAAGTVLEVMALAIPAVNVAMTGWFVKNVADPAYRKTVPTVLDIALLRMEFGADVN